MDIEAEARERVLSAGGRVHFEDAQVTPDHTGEIIVSKIEPNIFDAHIGFLQEKRRYAISISIPHYFGDEVSMAESVANVSVLGFKCDPNKTKHIITFEMMVDSDGPSEKLLRLKGSGESQLYLLKVSYTSIGIGKGTPMLKKGIHYLGHEGLDSDVSETG